MQCAESIAVTFIDYSVAFDTVSHKFLDKALAEAGMSNKVRAMFRTVYRNAEAFTTVQGAENKTAQSGSFPIHRGVLQGDITSPLYFILALDKILRDHDCRRDKRGLAGRSDNPYAWLCRRRSPSGPRERRGHCNCHGEAK